MGTKFKRKTTEFKQHNYLIIVNKLKNEMMNNMKGWKIWMSKYSLEISHVHKTPKRDTVTFIMTPAIGFGKLHKYLCQNTPVPLEHLVESNIRTHSLNNVPPETSQQLSTHNLHKRAFSTCCDMSFSDTDINTTQFQHVWSYKNGVCVSTLSSFKRSSKTCQWSCEHKLLNLQHSRIIGFLCMAYH